MDRQCIKEMHLNIFREQQAGGAEKQSRNAHHLNAKLLMFIFVRGEFCSLASASCSVENYSNATRKAQ